MREGELRRGEKPSRRPSRRASSRSRDLSPGAEPNSPLSPGSAARRGSGRPGGEPLSPGSLSPGSARAGSAREPLSPSRGSPTRRGSVRSSGEPWTSGTPRSPSVRRESRRTSAQEPPSPNGSPWSPARALAARTPSERAAGLAVEHLRPLRSVSPTSGRGRGGRGALAEEDEDHEADDWEGDSDVAWDRTRVWGAWEAVHPAALGRASQREAFPWQEPFRFGGGAGKTRNGS